MIRQCALIFGFLAVGELIVHFTGVKFPSSIIGMLLLTVSLKMGWVKVAWVKDISNFFVKTLPFYFVPAGVGVMLYFDLINTSFWAIVVASLGSTVIVLIVSGLTHQLIRNQNKKIVRTKQNVC